MEILGIGPSELLFIVIIALIVLGPRDMQKAGRTLGKYMRRIVTSDGWKIFQQTSREIQTLPNRLMREAALDELKEAQKDIGQSLDFNRGLSEPASTNPSDPEPAPETDNSIRPPASPPTSSPGAPDDEEKNA
jgi:sec-independent protein translocase protein TatB